MLTLRYALVPFKILLVPAIYLLARPAAGRPAAIVAALMVFMADSGVAFGMPHPGWYGLALSLLGLLALRAWLRGGRAAWLPGAGAAFGVAVAAKQNLGLFVFGARARSCCWSRLRRPPYRARARSAAARMRARCGPLRAGAWLAILAGLLCMLRDQFRPDVLVLLWLPVAALAAIERRAAAGVGRVRRCGPPRAASRCSPPAWWRRSAPGSWRSACWRGSTSFIPGLLHRPRASSPA